MNRGILFPPKFTRTVVVRVVICLTVLQLVGPSSGLRLTSMNTPLVADVRDGMELDCHFDMGLEDLYAVKWYKDDHEFFRYMPRPKPNTMLFPVPGVHLVTDESNCIETHCKVKLRNLTREQSGGAYRCEISSEAPAFRLASETHNITVAALPRTGPKIEGLTAHLVEGDTLTAKCVSDVSDPAPILSWYINNQPAPLATVSSPTTSLPDSQGLVSTSLSLRHPVDRQLLRSDVIEIRCEAALPGIPLSPKMLTKTLGLTSANEVQKMINNQKWYSSSATICRASVAIIFPFLLRQWRI